MERAFASPAESVMIGDSLEADVHGAIQIGMKAIHLTKEDNNNSSDFLNIKTLKELKKIFVKN